MVLGQKVVDNEKWEHTRKLWWTILCGYADPKKLPSSENEAWPLLYDKKPKLNISSRRINKFKQRLSKVQWNRNLALN